MPGTTRAHGGGGTWAGSVVIVLLVALVFGGLSCGDDPIKPSTTMGMIKITTITEGDALVPDSFEVQIGGERSGNTGPNAIYQMMNLPRGNHEIGLKESPPECRFSANPRTVLVTPGEAAETTFLIWCT